MPVNKIVEMEVAIKGMDTLKLQGVTYEMDKLNELLIIEKVLFNGNHIKGHEKIYIPTGDIQYMRIVTERAK